METKASPVSPKVTVPPPLGEPVPWAEPGATLQAWLTKLGAPQGADALGQNEANICIVFANEQASFVPFSSLGFSCLEC